ncbi:hypothetical protein [Burkholderia sp. PU8-34]
MATLKHSRDVENYARALFIFLVAVQNEPELYLNNSQLADGLKSQGSLAALRIDDYDIHPCALNTLKKSAQLVIPGGFSELDALRKSVSERLQHASHAANHNRRETRAYYKQRLGDALRENAQLKEDLWHISRAFYKAMLNARTYVTEYGDKALQARCADDEAELRAMASLATNKVVSVSEGKDNGH